MTTPITKEQAQRLRNDFECWQQDYDPVADKEQFDMFGLGMIAMDALLAAMDAEPVAWVMADDLKDNSIISTPAYRQLDEAQDRTVGELVELYTAPPAPEVPEDISNAIETLKKTLVSCHRYNYCSDAVKRLEDACLAAMLQAGNSPVIPDGWTGSDEANAALIMLDRIETVDSVDDDRIEGIKRIIRWLAAAPQQEE